VGRWGLAVADVDTCHSTASDGVKGVHAVVFSDCVNNVVRAWPAGERDDRTAVEHRHAVQRHNFVKAEGVLIHVSECEASLIQILTVRPLSVVIVGESSVVSDGD